MKTIDKIRKGEQGGGYPVFKGYPIKVKRKKVDKELHYIVPWEITEYNVSKSSE